MCEKTIEALRAAWPEAVQVTFTQDKSEGHPSDAVGFAELGHHRAY